jgi:hypothetical protein
MPPDDIVKAFNVEYKVRTYIFKILQFVEKYSKGEGQGKQKYFIESERSIPIFGHMMPPPGPGYKNRGGQKSFRPDFELIECENRDSICIIEVKKLFERPFKNGNYHGDYDIVDVKSLLK